MKLEYYTCDLCENRINSNVVRIVIVGEHFHMACARKIECIVGKMEIELVPVGELTTSTKEQVWRYRPKGG